MRPSRYRSSCLSKENDYEEEDTGFMIESYWFASRWDECLVLRMKEKTESRVLETSALYLRDLRQTGDAPEGLD